MPEEKVLPEKVEVPGEIPGEIPGGDTEVQVDDGPKGGGKKKKGGKRKLNKYFIKMLAAKRSNAPSFEYNGKTYYGRQNGHLGMVYSKSKSKSKSASKPSKKRRKSKGKSKRKPKKSRKKSRKKRRKSRRKSSKRKR